MVMVENGYSEHLMHCGRGRRSTVRRLHCRLCFPMRREELPREHAGAAADWRTRPVWTELPCLGVTFSPVVLGRFNLPPVSSSTSTGRCGS